VRVAGFKPHFRFEPLADGRTQMMLDPFGRRMKMVEWQFGVSPKPRFPQAV
jgi:hypothetical protein